MGTKEVRFSTDDPRFMDPQRITDRVREEFAKIDRGIHRHDVVELIDDPDREERILKISNPVTYFISGAKMGTKKKPHKDASNDSRARQRRHS